MLNKNLYKFCLLANPNFQFIQSLFKNDCYNEIKLIKMKKSNIYYNAVFKNNQMRDWAKKAAADLLISIDELKLENLEYYKKTDSEYDDIDQVCQFTLTIFSVLNLHYKIHSIAA